MKEGYCTFDSYGPALSEVVRGTRREMNLNSKFILLECTSILCKSVVFLPIYMRKRDEREWEGGPGAQWSSQTAL